MRVTKSAPYQNLHLIRHIKVLTGSLPRPAYFYAPHGNCVDHGKSRGSPTLEQMAAVEVAFRSGFANQSHFCFNFKRMSESAETVSDFRKNLSNIRKIIKDIGKQPCSLPGSTQVNPICTA
jgi:AraC-like DNA-binding protein